MEPQYIEHTIKFKELFLEMRSRWYLYVISFMLIIPLAFLYISYVEKTYEAESIILIKKQQFGSSAADQALTVVDPRNIERSIILQDEMSKLKSNDLINQTLEKLDFGITYYSVESFWPDFLKEKWLNELYGEVPFSITIDSSGNQLIGTLVHIRADENGQIEVGVQGKNAYLINYKKNKVVARIPEVDVHSTLKPGETWKNEYFTFSFLPKNNFQRGQDYYFKLNNQDYLVNQFRDNLFVELVQSQTQASESRVVRLSLVTKEPAKGQLFLDKLISTYSDKDLQNKNNKGLHTIKFLEKNIINVEDSLEQAKQSLQLFRVRSNIVDINNRKLLDMKQLSTFEEEKNLLENNLSYYKQSFEELNNGAQNLVAPSTVGIEDGVFEKLITNYIDVKSRADRVLNYENENNPLVDQLNRQLKSLQGAVKENLEKNIASTQANLNNVNRRSRQLEATMTSIPRNEQQLAEFEKKLNYYSSKYDYLVEKKTEAELALATNSPDIEVVDSATIADRPIAPNNIIVFLIAIALVLILPLGFVIPKYLAKEKLVNKDELEKQTEIPLLGMIANGPKNGKLVSQMSPNSAVAESFAYVRINLYNYFKEKANKVIGITSSLEGEGKTFCSANLACTLAESGLRTLLIEGDFRKPKLGRYFTQEALFGLSNYLEQDLDYNKIIQPTQIRNLDLIFAGSSDSNPIKLLEQPKMLEFIRQSKQKYDKIVIDTPPVGLVADYLVLQRYMDINIFVVRDNYTSSTIIKGINEIQKSNNIENINILFNDVETFAGYGNIKNSNGYYKKNLKRKVI